MFPAKTLICTENYKSMLLLMSSLLYINSHSPQIILEMTISIWNMMVHTLDQVLEQYILLVCSVLELSIDLKTAGDIGLLIIIIDIHYNDWSVACKNGAELCFKCSALFNSLLINRCSRRRRSKTVLHSFNC